MWHWLTVLNPKRLVAAAKISANLDLYEKLDCERSAREQLRDENAALRTELQQAREKLATVATARFDSGVVSFGDGYAEDNGPFCPTCWGKHGAHPRVWCRAMQN